RRSKKGVRDGRGAGRRQVNREAPGGIEDLRARGRGRSRARRARSRCRRGLVRGPDGPVGLGKDHAAQPDRRPRSAQPGERRGRGQATRRHERGRAREAALENVELPLLLTSLGSTERKKRAQTALRVVGLEDRTQHFPRQLSGGQEQRVAIARAIVNDPTIIVADEPTGDLDRAAADEILSLLEKLNSQLGKTI